MRRCSLIAFMLLWLGRMAAPGFASPTPHNDFVTYSYSLPYSTSNQSYWGPSSTTLARQTKDSFTSSWNIDSGSFGGFFDVCTPEIDLGLLGTIPAGCLGETGVKGEVTSKGTVGFKFDAAASGGTVDVNSPITLHISYPRFTVNPATLPNGQKSTFPVYIWYSTNNDANFNTTTPTASFNAYLIAKDFTFDGNLQVKALGDEKYNGPMFDHAFNNITAPGFNITPPANGTTLWNVFSSGTPGEFQLFSSDAALALIRSFSPDMELAYPDKEKFGDALKDPWFIKSRLNIPSIQAQGSFNGSVGPNALDGIGSDYFSETQLDFTNLLTFLLHKAGLVEIPPFNVDQSFDKIPGVNLSLAYNTFDVLGTLTFGIKQDFQFSPKPTVRLEYSTNNGATWSPLNFVDQIDPTKTYASIQFDDNQFEARAIAEMPTSLSVKIRPIVTFGNQFKQKVYLTTTGGLSATLLHFGVSGDALGYSLGSFDWTPVDPITTEKTGDVELATIGPWSLAGFDTAAKTDPTGFDVVQQDAKLPEVASVTNSDDGLTSAPEGHLTNNNCDPQEGEIPPLILNVRSAPDSSTNLPVPWPDDTHFAWDGDTGVATRNDTNHNSTLAQARVPADKLTPGIHHLTVIATVNIGSGGGTTQRTVQRTVDFTVNYLKPHVDNINDNELNSDNSQITSLPLNSQLPPNVAPHDRHLFLMGKQLRSQTLIYVNGDPLPILSSDGCMRTDFLLPKKYTEQGGVLTFRVFNPTPGGGFETPDSNPLTLNVFNANASVDNVSVGYRQSVSADYRLSVGSGDTQLALAGSNLNATTQATLNGQPRTIKVTSPTTALITILASDLATPGMKNLAIINPPLNLPNGNVIGGVLNGGGTTFNLNIVYPQPTIASLSPGLGVAGASGIDHLHLYGDSFFPGAKVQINGVARTTNYVSSTELGLALTAVDLKTPGALTIKVSNPIPYKGVSKPAIFNVQYSVPTVNSISPAQPAVNTAFTLTVTGGIFGTGSIIRLDGANLTTTFVDANHLTAPVSAFTTAGSHLVTVFNPAPGGGVSTPSTLQVQGVTAPAITSLSPPLGVVNGPSINPLKVKGSGFVAASQVKINGVARTTTFVSAQEVDITLSTADQKTPGTLSIVVSNPAASGGDSNSSDFLVRYGTPNLTSINPTSTPLLTAFTLTATGSQFGPDSKLWLDGAALTTTYNPADPTHLTAPVPALTTPGQHQVMVVNPSPGGSSVTQNLQVVAPVPTITSLDPIAGTVGGPNLFPLKVKGTGFFPGSKVTINGADQGTAFVSTQELNITLGAVFQKSPGTLTVQVVNPPLNGGNSNTVSLPVKYGTAVLKPLDPGTATANVPFTLKVEGSFFGPDSKILLDGVALTTTYSAADFTHLTAPVPGIATAGIHVVTVSNPAPGSVSAPQNLQVNNAPAPKITALNPALGVVNGPAINPLTITGTGFVAGSQVKVNGVARSTTFVSAQALKITLSTADQAAAVNLTVQVSNPVANGGDSNVVNFLVQYGKPAITTIMPTSVNLNTAFTLTVSGSLFGHASKILLDGTALVTTYSAADPTHLSASVAGIATAGNHTVTISNPAPGGVSNAVSLPVTVPPPTITSLAPSSGILNGPAINPLRINGTGFVSGSQVKINGVVRTATFVSAQALTLTLTTADQATLGNLTVQVSNPAASGGNSNIVNFPVQYGKSAITTITPISANANTAFTLKVTGSLFGPASKILLDGAVLTTTYSAADPTHLSALITGIAAAGSHSVTVSNPAPGGISNALSLPVTVPAPTITALNPALGVVNGPAINPLTITGTGFVAGSQVKVNGVARSTTFVSAQALKITLSTADQAAAVNLTVGVSNPVANGGDSNVVNFLVQYGKPAITTIAPTSVNLNTAFTLTVSGSLFGHASKILLDGTALVTTYSAADPTHLSASVAGIATTGNHSVTISNPAPGGVSNALNLPVTSAPPVTTIKLDGNPGSDDWFIGKNGNWGVVQVTLSSGAGAGIKTINYAVDGGATQVKTLNSAPGKVVSVQFNVTGDGGHSVTYWSVDNAGTIEKAQSQTIKIDSFQPILLAFGSPTTLWPPNGQMVPVTVSGIAFDFLSGVDPATLKYGVADEYSTVQPSGTFTIDQYGIFRFTVPLEASRQVTDRNGRLYVITVGGKDKAGNAATNTMRVVVPQQR